MIKNPIVIIGNPRSGTTLLRLMLTCHNNIVIPPECGFAVWWYEKYKHWNENSSQRQLNEFLNDLFNSKKFETWNLKKELLEQFLEKIKCRTYSELVSSIYECYGIHQKGNYKRWGDKNNFYLNHVETIFTLFPGCQFIHIIRDGRDVACSYRKLAECKFESNYAPKLPTDISDIVREWVSNINVIRTSFERIGWNKVIEIRYEDLVAEPENTLRKICSFLNEDFDDSMLDFYLLNREKELEPKELLQWKRKTLEKPTGSEVSKYKKELTHSEIIEFEKASEYLLKLYRYL